ALQPAQATSPLWHINEICDVVGGQCAGADQPLFGVQIDSRDVAAGDVFVAMPGTSMDGHDFVETAFKNGATAALVRRDWDAPDAIEAERLIRCDCPRDALIAMAVHRRQTSKAKVIGVTGSVGKTGLKDALQRCLGRQALAHTNVRSFNNNVGVPLTMARMPRETQYAVFEMGMNHAGELTELSGWVRPDVAVITTIAKAHYEFFESEEAIADAKAEIFTGLMPGGTAILPYDNVHYDRLKQAAVDAGAASFLTFGFAEEADVRARRIVSHGDCTTLSAQVGEQAMLLKIGIAGRHWVANALAALACIEAVGADIGLAALSLAELEALPGRGQVTSVPVGAGEILLMDDSYNANPASMAASIETFGQLTGAARGRRFALLGDMLELGDAAPEEHEKLFEPLKDVGADVLVCVGEHMEHLAKAAQSSLKAFHEADATAALARLRTELRAGDTLLVKGSNSIGLGKVVADLKDGIFALKDVR
ncbi:MAG: UDP-N-acetylmuramoyl-tripeptide--D-alanyl-D-alanine ligase, partial [Pseudomonadota bacterium]